MPLTEIQHAKTITDFSVQKETEDSINENSIERYKREISDKSTSEKPEDHPKKVTIFDGISEGFNPESVGRIPRDVTIPEQEFFSVRAATSVVNIEGLRIENSDKEPKIIEESIPSVLADSRVTLR